MWIKNTNKRPDAMLTFAAISFFVVTLNMFLSSFESISIGTVSIMFKSLDSSVMAVYLGATFTAYVSRRWTDKKYGKEDANPIIDVAKSVAEEFLDINTSPPDVALSQIEQEQSEDEIQSSKKRNPKK